MLRGKIYYILSEEGRKYSLVQGGNGHLLQMVEGEIQEQDLEIFNVDNLGIITMQIGFKCTQNELSNLINGEDIDTKINAITLNYDINNTSFYMPSLNANKGIIKFDKIMSFSELLQYRQDMILRLSKEKSEKLNELEKLKEESFKEQNENNEWFDKTIEEVRNKKIQELESFKKNMEEWINNFGSDRLKLLFEEGFNAEKLYTTERAYDELTDFVVDIEQMAEYESIEKHNQYIPGYEELTIIKALKESGFNPKIVFCIKAPNNTLDQGKFMYKNIPAILIQNVFNSSYNAYKEIDI